ncbi:MAG: hypothetical protein AAF587_18465 [Bacteroidota bacterium]
MIITFYSYKGGVGRSQLLSNIAAYLCYYREKRVLLLEWDLEAPGLHYFFRRKKLQKKGLIELFSEYVRTMRAEKNPSLAEMPYFNEEWITNIDTSLGGEGRIDLISAGVYDDKYTRRVNDFNWQEFYEYLDGKVYIEFLKKKLKEWTWKGSDGSEKKYDYILIDSRTGISDYSGICNIQMPDMNVIVMAPTDQNFAGCRRVIDSILRSPYLKQGYRKPLIMPILSRLDRNDNKESGKWFKSFRSEFKDVTVQFLEEMDLHISPKEFGEQTLLDYKRSISYGENILFKKKKQQIESLTLEKQYETIGEFIAPIEQNWSTTHERVQGLIAKGEIEKALQVLKNLPQFAENSSFLALESRYKKIRKELENHTIKYRTFSEEESRITKAILGYLRVQMPEQDVLKDDIQNSRSKKDSLLEEVRTVEAQGKKMIGSNRLEEAIRLLKGQKWIRSNHHTELVLLESQLNQVSSDGLLGLTSNDEQNRQLSKLRFNLLQLFDKTRFDLETDLNESSGYDPFE